jgi:hypothetical protein
MKVESKFENKFSPYLVLDSMTSMHGQTQKHLNSMRRKKGEWFYCVRHVIAPFLQGEKSKPACYKLEILPSNRGLRCRCHFLNSVFNQGLERGKFVQMIEVKFMTGRFLKSIN